MREVKFRIWMNNKIILPYDEWSNYHAIDLEGQICDIGDQNLQLNEDGGIIMQYTGLKDKNGEEIYESDLLGTTGNKKLVNYNINRGAWYVGYERLTISKANIMEIVGNKYED